VFLAVAVVLTCVGDGVARVFKEHANLDAYSLDIVGSIAGSAGFAILAFFHAPPLVWGVIIAGILLVTIAPTTVPRLALTVLPLLVLVGVWGAESFESDTEWTPYYKTEAQHYARPDSEAVIAVVNEIPTWFQQEVEGSPIYQTVYERITRDDPGDVLIVGAGSGNDVSVAVTRGATRVDAVEIDAHLLDLGRAFHPDRPYDNDNVFTHVQDGRAFLEQTDRQWDLILFALPDSLTLIQGQSAIRLESFLFTGEAADAAREHLRPGGVFAMYNFYREDWLRDRYAGTVDGVFGQAPCVSTVTDTVLNIITVSEEPASLDCPAEEQWTRPDDLVPAATDDRPFPYLRENYVPGFYLSTIALILLASIVAVRVFGGPFREMSNYVDLFFMGVAFLLLETKNLVQFALLFGTTWFVNALVFIGVLLSVLLAIFVAKRVTIRKPVMLYPVLFASLALGWAIPGSALLELSSVPRFVAAVTIAFLPIFTANLIFAERFRDTGDSTAAFGANLLGAMVGGLLEYSSLVLGYRNLLVVVAAVYGLALLTGRRFLVPATN